MTKSSTNITNDSKQLILDTHVLIWYMEGIKLSNKQVTLIDKIREENNLYVSAISIWEISMLAKKDKIAFSISLTEWIDNVLSMPGLNLIDLSVAILTESCDLPNYKHKDPADRLIIASNRSINAYLMTFDQKIIDYANQGYIRIVDES
jgi:PIN domain nuclease of toxin-antitoxin system